MAGRTPASRTAELAASASHVRACPRIPNRPARCPCVERGEARRGGGRLGNRSAVRAHAYFSGPGAGEAMGWCHVSGPGIPRCPGEAQGRWAPPPAPAPPARSLTRCRLPRSLARGPARRIGNTATCPSKVHHAFPVFFYLIFPIKKTPKERGEMAQVRKLGLRGKEKKREEEETNLIPSSPDPQARPKRQALFELPSAKRRNATLLTRVLTLRKSGLLE